MNYNRPNSGYEMEPWDRRRFQSKNTGLAKTIHTETIFIRGKHQGKSIGKVIDQDPSYCSWVLENQPNGIVAQQIIKHFNRKK
jgi:hypothetical protein